MRDEYLNGNQDVKDAKIKLANQDADISEMEDEIDMVYDDLR